MTVTNAIRPQAYGKGELLELRCCKNSGGDNEQGIRDLLDKLLRRQGYDVVLAESGWKGLELFYQERPDLKMAGIDGVTTLEQVLRLNPDQLVIIVTGTGTPEIEQQVRGLDVTASC